MVILTVCSKISNGWLNCVKLFHSGNGKWAQWHKSSNIIFINWNIFKFTTFSKFYRWLLKLTATVKFNTEQMNTALMIRVIKAQSFAQEKHSMLHVVCFSGDAKFCRFVHVCRTGGVNVRGVAFIVYNLKCNDWIPGTIFSAIIPRQIRNRALEGLKLHGFWKFTNAQTPKVAYIHP